MSERALMNKVLEKGASVRSSDGRPTVCVRSLLFSDFAASAASESLLHAESQHVMDFDVKSRES